ncbi:hypothetical protein F511_13367 [Dorcoceras hygrometricum]|uniref:DUF7054 domain-containing protein n=1 Tax=Dorcoceras hygrometricum TaxID=472368 RepID=A0A2Z7CD22_9LAMI|nr:hypothetical protein F511_13367 [Dorcoceras hygrometricum]
MKKSTCSRKMLSQKHISPNDELKGKKEGHAKRSSISLSHKHDDKSRRSRFLITINVFGSAGPLRFVVSEDDIAAKVIETALKQYAREGRLPVLGTDIRPFFLYNGFNALRSSEAIGSSGLRNFVMFKQMTTESRPHPTVDRKGLTPGHWTSLHISCHLSVQTLDYAPPSVL